MSSIRIDMSTNTIAGTSVGSPPDSLRERKKARTRACLIAVSQRRFVEVGYTETTLEEICAEVEVRPQTLLRYFDSKAHLALAPWLDVLELLRTQLDAPTRTGSTIDIWRAFVTMESRESTTPSSEMVGHMISGLRAFQAWADKDPVLVAMNSNLERQYQDLLASRVAADRGLGPDDLHSTLIAAMLVVGRRAVFERWLDRGGKGAALVDDQMAVIDYAVRSLPRRSARRLLTIAH